MSGPRIHFVSLPEGEAEMEQHTRPLALWVQVQWEWESKEIPQDASSPEPHRRR